MKIKKTVPLCLMIFLLLWTMAGAYDAEAVKRFGPPGTRKGGNATLAPCVSANFSHTIGDLWFPEIYSIGLSLYTGYYPGFARVETRFGSLQSKRKQYRVETLFCQLDTGIRRTCEIICDYGECRLASRRGHLFISQLPNSDCNPRCFIHLITDRSAMHRSVVYISHL